jgi:hypothetical protein
MWGLLQRNVEGQGGLLAGAAHALTSSSPLSTPSSERVTASICVTFHRYQ